MKKWLLSLAALMVSALSAYAQPVPGPGPGPTPGPWVTNGNTISYDGCLTVPRLVTGGCKGNGTGNFGALYVNGVVVSAGGSINPGTAGQLGYYATNGSAISGLTPGNLIQLSKGVSVLDPGTGKLEQVRPITLASGTNRTYAAGDLFTYVRRSNSGVAMSDTLPASNVIGLINGTPLIVANADATANLVLTAGAGTTVNGGSTFTLFPGQNVTLIYNFAALNWVVEYTTWTVLPAVNGGTGQSVYAIGDILAANTTTSLSRIADVATGNVLLSGGVGVLPSYGKVSLTTAVSSTLPVGNGGTGQTTLTQNGVLIGNGTGNVTISAAPTAGQLLVGQSSAAPTPQTVGGDCTANASASFTCTKTNGVNFTTAATTAMGNGANQIPQLNGSAQYPAADGSLITSINATWPPGAINGLTLSAASTTTIGIATGSARNNDAGTAFNMILASAFTKGFGTWAVGTGNGGLDTGTIAASTWYHVYLIRQTSGGAIDVLISLSATSPTMPGGWSSYRRIGSFLTNGSTQVTPFQQVGNRFIWDTPVQDAAITNPNTTATLRTLTVPTNTNPLAIMYNRLVYNQLSVSVSCMITNPANAAIAPGTPPSPGPYNLVASSSGNTGDQMSGTWMEVTTNSSAQIRTQCNQNSSNVLMYINTLGWIDTRGQ